MNLTELDETNSQEARLPTVDPEEQQHWGLKTAKTMDPELYTSADLEQLLDIGDLPDHLREKAIDMLRWNVLAFGFDGCLGQNEARIHIRTMEGPAPIAVPMYGTSPAKREVIEAQVKKWFTQGVIEKSWSPWSTPVVIAYRNGKPRLCVDYCKLNTITIVDEYPIPRQSEILASLAGSQVLSSLDVLSGFTQIEIDEDHIEKTAFHTHLGLFQFKQMPFRLWNGPSIFQQLMQGILALYLWLFKSYEEHIGHLDKVLSAIAKAGITLSPVKCHLFYLLILLLGHKVSRLGLSTHVEKVSAIMELSRPSKVSELQTFLGMIAYFTAFIPFYAAISVPLFQLLRKGSKWEWGGGTKNMHSKPQRKPCRKPPSWDIRYQDSLTSCTQTRRTRCWDVHCSKYNLSR